MLIAFSLETLIPIAIFGGVVAAIFFVYDMFFASGNSNAEDRLEALRNPMRSGGDAGDDKSAADKMSSLLEKATPQLAKALEPKSDQEQDGIKAKLSHAGFRRETAVQVFLGLKIICLAVGFFLGGGTFLLMYGFNKDALLKIIAITGLMFYLPNIVVWFLGRRRKEQIFLSLPDTLDLMVVCVEAGLGLDQAMRKVAEEMKSTYGTIADEFQICNFQLQMGRSRNDVLHELGQRTGVDDLRALASILIQADKFGSSVGQALRVQSDSMRTRRKQIAEEKAAKTAVQLIFPLVLFIFPGIFAVLVGPAAITMVRQMFPMMEGQ